MSDAVPQEREENGSGDYEVGYKKPPLHTRFGQPGVRNDGRPRGSKSLRNLLIQALRKKAKDGKGGEKEFYDVLTESIVVNAAKGNAALVKLIFDYHDGPPPQKHELTEFIYQGSELRETVRKVAELMRDFVPRERWHELAARLDEIDRATAE
jgi:hypothetical protein